jgi:hypothetical protein
MFFSFIDFQLSMGFADRILHEFFVYPTDDTMPRSTEPLSIYRPKDIGRRI